MPSPGEPDVRVLFARQPIVDTAGRIVGYELLFRRADGTAGAIEDDEQATAQVLVGALAELSPEEATGGKPAWIHVSRDFLLTVDPLPVAPGRVVLELLDHAKVDFVLARRLRELRDEGHPIALGEFVWRPDLAADLLAAATYAKLDIQRVDPATLAEQTGLLRRSGVQVVAEKVETHEERDRCAELGIELFQGWFFERPVLVQGRPVATNDASGLRTVAAVQAARGLDALERVVAQDAGLTVKLLRYVNSAGFGLRSKVGSVRQALVLLGEAGVRQWTTLLALSGLGAQRPVLLVTALARARTCRALAADAGATDPDAWFTAGLLSVADALLDTTLDAAIAGLALTDEIRVALLERSGPIGEALDLACRLERGQGTLPEAGARHLVEASRWADESLGALRAA